MPERNDRPFVLVETDGAVNFQNFSFSTGDTLVLGRERRVVRGALLQRRPCGRRWCRDAVAQRDCGQARGCRDRWMRQTGAWEVS